MISEVFSWNAVSIQLKIRKFLGTRVLQKSFSCFSLWYHDHWVVVGWNPTDLPSFLFMCMQHSTWTRPLQHQLSSFSSFFLSSMQYRTPTMHMLMETVMGLPWPLFPMECWGLETSHMIFRFLVGLSAGFSISWWEKMPHDGGCLNRDCLQWSVAD